MTTRSQIWDGSQWVDLTGGLEQKPLEVFYTNVEGVLGLTTTDAVVDSFVLPRTGRWLLHVVLQGNYASLTEASVFQAKIKREGLQQQLSTVNLFRAWGAPGVTTGHFSTSILFRTGFEGAGVDFTVTVSRFGTDGGVNLTDLDRSAINVENIA